MKIIEKLNRPLKNDTCPYCDVELIDQNRTKEHVVGRRFVPKDTLSGQPNLILFCCQECNSKKADLENDISAITMQPSVRGEYYSSHPSIASEAERKGQGSTSFHTRKKVSESVENKSYAPPSGSNHINFLVPAQIDDDRAFDLASMHFKAFLYLIFFNSEAQRAYVNVPVAERVVRVGKKDWGDKVAVAFMEETFDWAQKLIFVTAEGHFRLAIRKHPSRHVYSLAVEWNQNERLLAFAGDEASVVEASSRMPDQTMLLLQACDNRVVRYRTEQSLRPDQDTMFEERWGLTS